MAKHRLLVSGVNGFVGSILERVARDRDDVVLAPLSGADGVVLDIRDADAVNAAVKEFQPTAVIHLAAQSSPRLAAQSPYDTWTVNVLGTFNLAQAILKNAPKARFVFAGSSDAYGASFLTTQKPIDEDAKLDPISVYGATKAAAEIMLCQMEHEGLKVTRFRPFNHTGPGQSPQFVVPAFARQIVRIERGLQKPVLRVGNLDGERDLLNVDDVVEAYLLAALGADETAGAYNLATGAPISIGDILKALVDMSSAPPVSVESDPKILNPNEIKTISGNPRKTENVLGWTASVPIEDTLQAVLKYWRQVAES